jgi:hypothetical protein
VKEQKFRKSSRRIVEEINKDGAITTMKPCIEIWDGVWFCPCDELIFDNEKDRDEELSRMRRLHLGQGLDVVGLINRREWRFAK